MGGPRDQVSALCLHRCVPLVGGHGLRCPLGSRPIEPMDPAGQDEPVDQSDWGYGRDDEQYDRRVVVADEHRPGRNEDAGRNGPDDHERGCDEG